MKKLILALLLSLFIIPQAGAEEKETAYERVMRTGTIRCGYIVWAPMFMKDSNTGEFSGIFYDYMEKVGDALDLNVKWTEEVTPATYVEALRTRRFDMLCSADWPNASRGKYLDYVDPVFYLALVPFTRLDDTRFDNALSSIDDPGVTVSVIDGEMSSIIVRSDFPLARTLELPQMADAAQMLMNVADGKADVAITALTTGLAFQEKNPDKLRQVPLGRPVRLFPNTLSLPLGEDVLRQVMNTVTRELHYSGTIEKIIDKYEEYPGSFYRVSLPYAQSTP